MTARGRAPAFQLYAGDWLADTFIAALSMEEVGCYITLLCHQWEAGSIPTDPERVARLLRGNATAWSVLREKFPGGKNPRLDAARGEDDQYRATQRKNGAAGNAKRWGKNAPHRDPSGDDLGIPPRPFRESRNDRSSSSSSSSSSSATTSSATPPQTALPVAGSGARVPVEADGPPLVGTNGSASKPAKAKRKKKPPHPEFGALRDWWHRAFKQTQDGCDYTWGVKDTVAMSRLLSVHTPEVIRFRLQNGLRSDDDWLMDHGKTLPMLAANFDKPALTGVNDTPPNYTGR